MQSVDWVVTQQADAAQEVMGAESPCGSRLPPTLAPARTLLSWTTAHSFCCPQHLLVKSTSEARCWTLGLSLKLALVLLAAPLKTVILDEMAGRHGEQIAFLGLLGEAWEGYRTYPRQQPHQTHPWSRIELQPDDQPRSRRPSPTRTSREARVPSTGHDKTRRPPLLAVGQTLEGSRPASLC